MKRPASANHSPELPTAVARLVARERVRAMESLAAVVAHEMRTAVVGVTSAAQLLRYAMPPGPVAERSIGRILQESERLSALHDALAEYSTESPPRFVAGNPDDVWHTVVANLRGALEARAVLLTHAAPDRSARCLIDVDQLTRAFERIVHHALSRAPAGAELDIISEIGEHGDWQSTISIATAGTGASAAASTDFERPTIMLALAQRTLTAHGGELTDHAADDASLLVSLRIPGASDA